MGNALRKEKTHYTYADYRQWPEGERFELIDGEAYAMGPAPSRRHQEVVLEIARQIADALEGTSCRPYLAPFDVRLPRENEADEAIDTVVQPDISVICDKGKLDDAGCRGAPDWIVEVLSPATVGRDQIVKRALYEKAGVREYWIVHPTDRVATIYLLEAGAYGKPAIFELVGTTAATILPQVVIDWARAMRES